MDYLATHGMVGTVRTIPEGMPAGSDVANLSVMGYNPSEFYTGRSPFEAISMGISLNPKDMVFRCNLVTLSEEENYDSRTMVDYSSDEISTAEARELIEYLDAHLGGNGIEFHAGISYRHCMVWKKGPSDFEPNPLTPPHDISREKIRGRLPRGTNGSKLYNLMTESSVLLKDHPINKRRIKNGLHPANSIWFWGEGRKPAIPSFSEKFGITGSVVSAVDLVKGIGICAGLDSVTVEGATGNFDTNYKGKAEKALQELKSGKDFVYIHIEAPDECGHRHEIDKKVKSIELIDKLALQTLLNGLEEFDDYSILLLPDHPTPLSLMTHTADPVPFALYNKHLKVICSSKPPEKRVTGFDEVNAKKTELSVKEGHLLIDFLVTDYFKIF